MRGQSENDPRMKKSANRLATEVNFRSHHEHFLTCRVPACIQKFTKCCPCHEKWHFNFTKCCTYHKKWLEPLNFTKCCTCQKKWHLNLTNCCTCHDKWHLNISKCCTCHEKSHLNFTQCCTCHAKWLACFILVTKETLQCAEQQASRSNLTKYCACHAERLTAYNPRHIWNVIYNARSNSSHDRTSPTTAPAT